MRRALVVTAAAGALVGLAGAPARADVVLSGLDSNPSLGGNDGVARTILPGDNKHGRWVSNLDAIIVPDVPEPASLTVLAAGLALLGWFRGANRDSSRRFPWKA